MRDYKNYILMLLMSVALVACDANVRDDDSEDGADAGSVDGGSGSSGSALDSSVSYDEDAINDAKSVLARRTIYFDFNSSKVKSDFADLIKHHGKYLAINKSANVRLEGHTDERGTREYNVALADRRAQAVKRLLLFQGATSGQVTVISYGEEKPVALGSDETAWRQNRRAEIVYK
jgi:peptidoglycan-associated lipoprotein